MITFLLSFLLTLKVVSGMTDQEFFSSVNLFYPGLDSVRAALISGDTAMAKIRLLQYYRERTGVNFFSLSENGDVSQAEDNLNHYFTVVNIRKYAGDSDGSIDWTTSDPSTAEWHYQFHRMYWIINLGKVYANTQDERYAQEWIAELVDWANDNTPGYPRTLDTGVRLRNWVESYQYFINAYDSPSISPEDNLVILKSLIEQCRFLRDNWRSEGNWGASETRGLCSVVVMFPEFRFTPEDSWDWWKDLVVFRMQHHLSNDFYPDGVQFETSPMYHSLEYRNLFLAYSLMNMNNIVISDTLKNLFIKPLEFMMHVHKPDGNLPQISDTDNLSYLNRLKEGAQLFDRDDMLYAATKGNQGIHPENTFAAFPDGGYFIMRSDWGENQSNYNISRYLIFDTGSNDPWHAHYDILNFEAYAYGRTIIKDPGRFSYTQRRLDYYKRTLAHNTVVVDNLDQAEKASGVPVLWRSLHGFDYVEGYHDAYNNLRHRRGIFFVKPEYWIVTDLITGEGFHSYDLYYHLESAYQNHWEIDMEDRSVSTPNFIILPGDTTADISVIPGWVSHDYGEEEEAPTVKYSKQDYAPVNFESIIYPFPSNSISVTVDKQIVFNRWGWELTDDEATGLKICFPSYFDYFCVNYSGEDSLRFASFKFAGKIAIIRENSLTGEITDLEILEGTYLTVGDTILVNTGGTAASISWHQGYVSIQSQGIHQATIWAPDADSVLVNGESVGFSQIGNYVEFSISSIADKKESGGRMPENFQLFQNYPNPFNHSTVIPFYLYHYEKVELKILDLTGRTVAILEKSTLPPGQHLISWNGQDMNGVNIKSGVYLYSLKTGSAEESRKMVILK